MEDKNIIDLFWERSETAISETSDKYGRYCYTIAFNILASHSDAVECENDTYLGAWNTIPPVRPNRFSAFLGRLTRNIALDKFDYNTAEKRNHEFDAILSELEDCIPSQTNVEDDFEAGQLAKIISDFLRTVQENNRNVFIRRYWYSDSINNIAARFGISNSQVKSMLYRTRNKLKQYLDEKGVKL